jgi:MFS family permease
MRNNLTVGLLPPSGSAAVEWRVSDGLVPYEEAVTFMEARAVAIAAGREPELTWLIVFGYALAFFHDGGFSGVAPYTPELYPTHARSTGVGWANGAGRIGATIAPIVVGFLIAAQGTYAVFVVFAIAYLAVVAVVLMIAVETKGKILEEAALDPLVAKD